MADIVLRDRSGNLIEYPGVERVKLNTVDGEAVEFVDSATIPAVLEDLPIALDFSSGDQTISAPDGMVVKSAVVQKPDTLTPENIAEGVDIAGIIGTLAAGGGSNVKIATGTDASNSTIRTISHGLGVTPDLVYVWSNSVGTTNCLFSCFGITKQFKEAIGIGYAIMASFVKNGTITNSYYSSQGIDGTAGWISNVNGTSFKVGTSTTYFNTGSSVTWIAIGGLT